MLVINIIYFRENIIILLMNNNYVDGQCILLFCFLKIKLLVTH